MTVCQQALVQLSNSSSALVAVLFALLVISIAITCAVVEHARTKQNAMRDDMLRGLVSTAVRSDYTDRGVVRLSMDFVGTHEELEPLVHAVEAWGKQNTR